MSTGELQVVNTTEAYVNQLEALQRIVFPTLTDEELFTAAKYRKHMELFPEGQFTALIEEESGPVVVGATSTYRTDFDFDHIQHTFLDAVAHGWLTNHDPNGAWLYGVDVSVHPGYRRRGIGSALYAARYELVQRLNLRGEIAGGMLPGYDRYRQKMSIEEYVERCAKGEIVGMTLTMQVRNGFRPVGILYDHLTDPRSDNCAALIVRKNPDFRP